MLDLSKIAESLRPVLESLEAERQTYRRKRGVFLPIALLAPVIGLLVGLALEVGIVAIFFALFAGVIGAVVYHFCAGSLGGEYVKKYKATVLPALVKQIDPKLGFRADLGIPESSFVNSELFSSDPDRYSTEDLIQGYHGETFLQLAEIHAEDRRTRTRDGKTETYYVTIFKGILLIADFNKHFLGRTFVLPDAAERMFGGFGRALQKLSGRSGTSLVQLEDVEFEKAFVVHSTDQVESRYILSSAMMRRLLEVRQTFGKDVRVAFKESQLFIAVPHNEPYLEPKTGINATDPSQLRSMLAELGVFLEVVETLDLNTRIWTKD